MTPAPDAFKFIDRRLVYPPLMTLNEQLLHACAAEGAIYYASRGYSTPAEQAVLWEIGRSTPGPHAGEPGYPALGLPVTRARPWESQHQHGVATDWTRDAYADRAGLQPDWQMEHYEPLARNAVRLGLEALFYSKRFREGPHVGLALEPRGLSIRLLTKIAQRYRSLDDGRRAVWDRLDDSGPWGVIVPPPPSPAPLGVV